MRGQGSKPTKNTALRRALIAVLTLLLPIAAIAVFAGEAMAQGPVKLHLDHWGNGGSPQTVAKWRDGNLHWTNSHYQEGDADPTRFIMDNLTPDTQYSLTFTYMAIKKQAKVLRHGHDFLTNFTFSEFPSYTPNTGAGPVNPTSAYPDPCKPRVQGGGKPPNVCELNSAPFDVFQIPIDEVGPGVDTRQTAAGVPQYFAMWNGDITSIKLVKAPDEYYSYSPDPNGSFKDTTYITVTINFTAKAQGEGEGVVLAFAGHLAKSTNQPTGWGAGQGAADIDGAPYHWAYNLVATNSGAKVAQGARNRSIMIRRNGHIQIVKECVNADGSTTFPENFPFTATNPPNVQDGLPASFDLDCDPEGTIEQSTVLTGNSGQYSITESPLDGYAVTKIVCSLLDGDGQVIGTRTPTLSATLPVAYPNSVTATIAFNAGETIRCVFTNTKPDAYIVISHVGPDVNLINQAHTVKAKVYQNKGDGAGYIAAPLSTLVTFSLPLPVGNPAFFVGGVNTCNTNASGECTVTINSPSAVDVTIHATTTVSVLGYNLVRATGDGISLDGPDIVKHYVPPSPGNLEIVKCVVNNDLGTADPDDFQFYKNGSALSWSLGLPAGDNQNRGSVSGATCPQGYSGSAAGFKIQVPLTTNAQGQVIPVTVVVTEDVLSGYTKVVPAGSSCSVTFDGTAATGTQRCTFVNTDNPDAYLQLTPLEATNTVGDPHVITATVKKSNAGGYINAAGETVVFSLTAGSPPAAFVPAGTNTCVTNASGQCSVTINSQSPTSVTIHATVTVNWHGATLVRATGDGLSLDSPDAHKLYVSLPGRMTGGGSVFYPRNSQALVEGKKEGNVRITHGFELHCTDVGLPNRLEVVWHDGSNAFHLESIDYTKVKCTQVSNPPDQEQPEAHFDTYEGEGYGRVNSNPGALYKIKFKLTDHGEPGGKDATPNSLDTADFVLINVSATGTPLYLSSYGEKALEQGNHQAHLEQKAE